MRIFFSTFSHSQSSMLLTISSFSTGKLCRFSESFLGFLGAAGEVDGDATSATAWVPIVRSTLPLFPLLEAVHRGAIRTAPVAVAPSEAIMLSTQGYKVKGGERGEEEEEKKERDKESALVLDSLSSSSLLVVSRARKQLPPPAHHRQQHRQALPTPPPIHGALLPPSSTKLCIAARPSSPSSADAHLQTHRASLSIAAGTRLSPRPASYHHCPTAYAHPASVPGIAHIAWHSATTLHPIAKAASRASRAFFSGRIRLPACLPASCLSSPPCLSSLPNIYRQGGAAKIFYPCARVRMRG